MTSEVSPETKISMSIYWRPTLEHIEFLILLIDNIVAVEWEDRSGK